MKVAAVAFAFLFHEATALVRGAAGTAAQEQSSLRGLRDEQGFPVHAMPFAPAPSPQLAHEFHPPYEPELRGHPYPTFRNPGTDPFMVSFKVQIVGDNKLENAQKLSKAINTPGDDAARIMSFSMARWTDNMHSSVTFPPVDANAEGTGLPPAPGPGPAPVPMPAPAPAPFPFPMPGWNAEAVAKAEAQQALDLANLDAANLKRLRERMQHAADQAKTALYYKGPVLDPLAPTTTPQPPTLGRLLYDALLNTPAPPTTTLSPIMAAQAMWAKEQMAKEEVYQKNLVASAGWLKMAPSPAEAASPSPA